MLVIVFATVSTQRSLHFHFVYQGLLLLSNHLALLETFCKLFQLLSHLSDSLLLWMLGSVSELLNLLLELGVLSPLLNQLTPSFLSLRLVV